MAEEIWYRGEAIGVARDDKGVWTHDLGVGWYFADNRQNAR